MKNVDVGRPREATFVAFSGFVGQHCNENAVWMDSAAFDVLCVCEAVEDVFRVMLGVPLGVPPPYDGMQLAVDVFWVDDSDFCGGEFAKIADECG